MKPWTWSCPSSPGKLNSTAAAGRVATSARTDTARTKRIPAARSFQPEETAVYLNSVSTRRCPSASFPMSSEHRSYDTQWEACDPRCVGLAVCAASSYMRNAVAARQKRRHSRKIVRAPNHCQSDDRCAVADCTARMPAVSNELLEALASNLEARSRRHDGARARPGRRRQPDESRPVEGTTGAPSALCRRSERRARWDARAGGQ